ncbi:ABC transporter permease [Geodermatophilus sp. FMUSA9-8]|uniref:ABC transporter permease n=1 Tax=Geodermatophilus sp. FMUSA9-8 TaxID=3120155 RepID=UPI00300B570F
MLLFLLRRLGAGVVLVWVIATLTFFLTSLTGSDPARRILGPTAGLDQVAAKTAELGLDRPVLERYWDWLTGAVRGDLGTSWFTNAPVGGLIGDALPVSLSLVIAATVLTAAVSIALGVVAAVRGGWLDGLLQTISTVAFAVPNFLVGLLLSLVFAVELGLFPALGYTPLAEDPGAWLASIALPAIALAIGAIATVATQTRGSMIDVLQQDYVRTLRSRGLPARSVLLKHALRNAAPASLTVLSLQFIALISGAVVIEKVFGLNGLGERATSAAGQGDVPLVLGIVVVAVVVVVVVNLVVDLALGWLNPKVRIA